MSTEGNYVENKKSDCLSCRLIRGLGCVGVGSYLLWQGKQVKGYHRGSVIIFGGCIGILGLASLFDIDLFNSRSKLS